MAEGERVIQHGTGDHIAQATGGAKAIVEDRRTIQTIYQFAAPQPIDEIILAKAEVRLAELPVDAVPDPAGLPPGSLIPFTRNALFVGRTDDLKMLAAALKKGGTAAVGQSAAVTGLGGIGKTQLASEFAYRYGRYFAGGVFWLSFANPDAIAVEIATCGGPTALNLHPDFENLPLNGQVGMVASAWHSDLPRLLVFDNCEDEALLVAWAPRSGGCRVLVTGRRGTWSADLGLRVVPLGVLARQESVALLHKHRPDRALDDPELAAIAAELGDLPLALHLAGSFLKTYRHAPQGQPEAYLAAVRRPDVLAHKSLTLGGRSPTGHEQHVARTFALSYEGLDGEEDVDAAALTVLARAAWFAPGQPVPRDLLAASAGVEADDEAVRLLYEDALARLIELGLLEEERDGALVLHRLLAVFVRSVSKDSVTAREAVEATVWAEAWQISERGYPAPLLAWQPHLRAVADEAEQAGSARAGGLFNRLGYHLRMVADFPGARQAFERALRIEERTFGPNHPNVAREVNNLGGVLQVLGDLAGARAACERAVATGEKVDAPTHP
jgi:hypothetical protein